MLCNREHGGAEIEQPQPAANPPTALPLRALAVQTTAISTAGK